VSNDQPSIPGDVGGGELKINPLDTLVASSDRDLVRWAVAFGQGAGFMTPNAARRLREIAMRLPDEKGEVIDEIALGAAANVFMSYLPNNNRATSDADRGATRSILESYFAVLCARETK